MKGLAKFLISFIFTFFISVVVFSQSVSDIPGLIPLNNQRPPASDLIYNGKILLPDQLRELQRTGVIPDLSLLDPDETSVLWKKQPTQGTIDPEKSVEIDLSKPFEFVEYSPDTVGRMTFTLSQKNARGELKVYRARMESRAHNILLRKNLLRKLGYNVAPIVWAPQLKLAFKGNFSRDEFEKEITNKTFLPSQRWVIGKDENQITLQDLVIFADAEDMFYNLARGDMIASIIQNRRVLNALLVPYNLVDVSESVNVFGWTPGKVFNGQLSLPYEDSLAFSTSYEDARWITRRILNLKREDFTEIVKNAFYPPEVESVLIEKIISRRNFLRKYLDLEAVSAEIAVNTNIPKLEKQEWPGYAQNFAFGDPDSPLSGEELFSFFKSKVTSNLITNLVSEFNARYIPRTDIGWKIFDRQLDIAARQFAEFITTGKITETPFGFYTFPMFDGSIIANREVVTGSYLGTDNLVQLADVVGFNVEAGWYIGADGLPTKVGFQGGAKGYITRTYTHLKPIKSIKLALKEPFRNILVPNYKGNIGTQLAKIFSKEYQALDKGDQIVLLQELANELREKLNVGESIIITTTVGAGLTLTPSLSLSNILSLVTSWSKSQTLLSRVHIYRANEDTIQIYKDPAHMNTKSLYLGLHAYIPFLTYKLTNKEGRARTDFYSLNINSDPLQNEDLEKNLKALSRVFLYSKLDYLKNIQNPYVIQHKFREKVSESNFFVWRSTKQKTSDLISVQHPTGYQKDFVKYTTGKRKGRNYEALAVDVINALLAEYSERDIMIQSSNSGDPADSVYGDSVSQYFTFESEVSIDNTIKNPFVSLAYRWRKWSMDHKKILDLITDINERFKYEFFHPSEFQSTEKIQLSTFSVSANIYERGIKFLLSFTKEQISDILKAHGYDPNYKSPGAPTGTRIAPKDVRDKERAARYHRLALKMFENFKKAYQEGNVELTVKYMSEFITFIEKLLPVYDFYQLFGGEDNIFVRSQVFGFRVGDEKEDNGLTSHTLGRIGSEKGDGPLKDIQRKMGVTESEFFIYWLMNRI